MSEKIDFVQKIVMWIEEKQIFSRETNCNLTAHITKRNIATGSYTHTAFCRRIILIIGRTSTHYKLSSNQTRDLLLYLLLL